MRSMVMLALTLCASGSTFGVIIPSSARSGPVPVTPGDGLNARVWLAGYQNSTLASNLAYAESTAASGSFRSTIVDYPRSSDVVDVGDPLASFLGDDAASIVGFDVATQNSAGHLYRFNGFLAIPEAGTFRYGVGSDDGFTLAIGGQTVAFVDGDRGFGYSFGDATFDEPGLYPVSLFYFANFVGQSGVDFAQELPSGAVQSVPGSALYAVPAPSALAALGLAGLLSARRRR